MAQVNLKDQLDQLQAARNLVLSDAALYPQVVSGILPIVGVNSALELRRWGSDFLAETVANPALAAAQKEQLATTVLSTVREYLEHDAEDVTVVQNAIQIAASVYPFVFRYV